MHFAAHTIVPESVSDPLKYYGNNTCATRNLLQCCAEAGRASTSCSPRPPPSTAYRTGRIADESTPDGADQPLRHLEAHVRVDAARPRRRHARCAMSPCAISTSRARIPSGRIGQSTRKATLLVKVACEVAVGQAPARSRSSARTTPRRMAPACATTSMSRTSPRPTWMPSTYLRDGGSRWSLNCGYGHGYSVREVIASVEKRIAATPARREGRAPPRRRSARSWSPGPTGPLDPRLDAPARRPGRHRAHLARLGTQTPARALVDAPDR